MEKELPNYNTEVGGYLLGRKKNQLIAQKDSRGGGLFIGRSHAENGGIKTINIDTKEPLLVEGNEVILNKRSMALGDTFTCTGTPKQMASKINELEGGVSFDQGGSCKPIGKMAKDGIELFKTGNVVNDEVVELHRKLLWLLNNHISSGGNLDFSEKEYGYMNDALDEVEIGYFGNVPDGDHQNELADEGFTMTKEEATQTLTHRIEMIEEEVGPQKYAQGGGINEEKYVISYLDKKNNFRQTDKEFTGKDSYEEAVKWGKKNLPNFNSDMVRRKFDDGGGVGDYTIKIGEPLTENNIDGAIIQNILNPEWGTFTVLKKYDEGIWEIKGSGLGRTLNDNEFKFWKRINYAGGGGVGKGYDVKFVQDEPSNLTGKPHYDFTYSDEEGRSASGFAKFNPKINEFDIDVEEINGEPTANESTSVHQSIHERVWATFLPFATGHYETTKMAWGGIFKTASEKSLASTDEKEVAQKIKEFSSSVNTVRNDYRQGDITGKEYAEHKSKLIEQYKPYISKAEHYSVPVNPSDLMVLSSLKHDTGYAPTHKRVAEDGTEIGRVNAMAQDLVSAERARLRFDASEFEKTFKIVSFQERNYIPWYGKVAEIEKYIKENKELIPDYSLVDNWETALFKFGLEANEHNPALDVEQAAHGTIVRSSDVNVRRSPSISATVYPEGYEMQGNDSNIWKISVSSNGVHRWVKKHEDGGGIYAGGCTDPEMKDGGFVSKGEMVWNKLTSSKRAEFLYENFTPEITPRSQEILVGKAYNFLPKNVKNKIEAKYANVEEYSDGGGVGEKIVLESKLTSGKGDVYRALLITNQEPYKSVIRPEKYSKKMQEWISTGPGWKIGTLLGIEGYYGDGKVGDTLYIDMGQNSYVTGMSAVLEEAQKTLNIVPEMKDGGGVATAPAISSSVITFDEFKSKMPDIESPYIGEEGILYKPKYDTYSGRTAYFKHGRRSSDKMSVLEAYTHYLYSNNQIRWKTLSQEEKKNLIGEKHYLYTYETGGDIPGSAEKVGHRYHLDDEWNPDFDYDGMLKMAFQANLDWGVEKLKKLFHSLEDVNYATPAKSLGDAIKELEAGNTDEASRLMAEFHEIIKDYLGQAKDGKYIAPNYNSWLKNNEENLMEGYMEHKYESEAEGQKVESFEEWTKNTFNQVNTMLSSLQKKKTEDGAEIKVKDPQIAKTILEQLGGTSRLNIMTGAYNFIDRGNGLSFRIKNQRANYIKITLTGMDLYDVEIGRIRGLKYTVVKEVSGVYSDQLKPIIEKATGMYLTLYKGGGEIYTTKDVTAPNYGINYWVGKEKGKWTIFSENTTEPKWKKRNEFESGFVSEADAILVAKGMTGEEEDPEAFFFRHTEMKGGGPIGYGRANKGLKDKWVWQKSIMNMKEGSFEKGIWQDMGLLSEESFHEDIKQYLNPEWREISRVGDRGENTSYPNGYNYSFWKKDEGMQVMYSTTKIFKDGGGIKNESNKVKFGSIEELIVGNTKDAVKFIYEIIKSDSYYTEEVNSLYNASEQALQVLSMLAVHDINNPILTKFNDKVFFSPDPLLIKRDGIFIATIKYAIHFVTGKTKDKQHRTFDPSKAKHLGLLFDCIHNPEKRIVEKDGDKTKIYYCKKYILKETKQKTFVSLFFIELEMDGHIRYITIMPDKSKNWGDKKEKGGLITVPPSIFQLPPNSSVKDVQVWETSSSATEHSNTKESNTNIDKFYTDIIKLSVIYNNDNQEVVNIVEINDDMTRFTDRNLPSDETQTISTGGGISHSSNTKSNTFLDENKNIYNAITWEEGMRDGGSIGKKEKSAFKKLVEEKLSSFCMDNDRDKANAIKTIKNSDEISTSVQNIATIELKVNDSWCFDNEADRKRFINIVFTAHSDLTTVMYEVELEAVPNPDHDISSPEGSVNIPKHRIKVKSLTDAWARVNAFVISNNLGGGNFIPADVYDIYTGEKIGHFSYNGRLWDNNDNPLDLLNGS